MTKPTLKTDKDPFTMVPHSFFRDESLSLEARGLAVLLKGHGDGFVIRQAQLMKALKIGRTRLNNAIEELECRGFLNREQPKADDGQVIPGPWNWEITLINPAMSVSDRRKSDRAETGGSLEEQPFKKNKSKKPCSPKKEDLFGDENYKTPIAEKPFKGELIFTPLWDHLRRMLPPTILARSSRKAALAQFQKAVEGGVDPVAMVDAIKFMLSQNAYSKENYQYLPALQRLIRDEKYEPFLGKVADGKSKRQREKERDYKMWARWAAAGKEGQIPMLLSNIPAEARVFFDVKDRQRFGWE